MKSKIPKIKKELAAFLVGEEGKISKQHILTIGAFLAVSSMFLKDVESNLGNMGLAGDWTDASAGGTLLGSHTHHGSHSSY